MRYVFLRLFLSSVEQPPILIASGDVPPKASRQEYLSTIFSDSIEFTHRGVDMVYVPIRKEADEDATFIFGRIGRKVRTVENSGPEESFEFSEHVSWRAANLVLDTSSDPDGQKIAMQDRVEVGRPLAIISSLASHVNSVNINSGWHLNVNAVTERQSFWDAVEKYKGQITRAEFSYVTPNVLGIRSELNKRLKQYREQENAQQVTVTLLEPRGNLNLDTQEVKDAVDYISEGGGTAKLKAGKEVIFDSEDTDKAVNSEVDDALQFSDQEGRKELIGKFFP